MPAPYSAANPPPLPKGIPMKFNLGQEVYIAYMGQTHKFTVIGRTGIDGEAKGFGELAYFVETKEPNNWSKVGGREWFSENGDVYPLFGNIEEAQTKAAEMLKAEGADHEFPLS